MIRPSSRTLQSIRSTDNGETMSGGIEHIFLPHMDYIYSKCLSTAKPILYLVIRSPVNYLLKVIFLYSSGIALSSVVPFPLSIKLINVAKMQICIRIHHRVTNKYTYSVHILFCNCTY